LYQAYIDSDDPAEQTRIRQEWEQRCFDIVTHLPLGRFVLPSAWRETVSGQLKGPAAVFWNVAKGEKFAETRRMASETGSRTRRRNPNASRIRLVTTQDNVRRVCYNRATR
jgi:hypothetical protein